MAYQPHRSRLSEQQSSILHGPVPALLNLDPLFQPGSSQLGVDTGANLLSTGANLRRGFWAIYNSHERARTAHRLAGSRNPKKESSPEFRRLVFLETDERFTESQHDKVFHFEPQASPVCRLSHMYPLKMLLESIYTST